MTRNVSKCRGKKEIHGFFFTADRPDTSPWKNKSNIPIFI